jgi:hypothetical protein
MQKVTLATGARCSSSLITQHAASERVCVCDIRGHLAQQNLATNYEHTAASDYIHIYINTSSVFYQCRDLYEAHSVQKCCKLPTSLSPVYESRFCGFRRTNIRRLFSAKLEPAQRELELIKTTCSSSVRIFYSTGDPIILATKPYLTDDVRERVGKMCFLLCTLSDNEFFSTAADSRYI